MSIATIVVFGTQRINRGRPNAVKIDKVIDNVVRNIQRAAGFKIAFGVLLQRFAVIRDVFQDSDNLLLPGAVQPTHVSRIQHPAGKQVLPGFDPGVNFIESFHI